MDKNLNFLKPSYQRENQVSVGFLISCIFCSNFKYDKFDRRFAYIFHITRLLDFNQLKTKYVNLTDEDLLREIFFLSRNDKYFKLKHLRVITGIKARDTFRDRFKSYLVDEGLDNRVFNLEEIYKILDYWNPDFKGNSMKALLKKELADQFTNGDRAELATILLDNGIVTEEEFKDHKLSPKVYNKLNEFLNENLKKESGNPYFNLYFLFLLSRIKNLE